MAAMWERAARPVDIASLVVFRVVFGLTALLGVARYLGYGWVGLLYEAPTYFFTYAGFDGVHPWPAPWMRVHYAAMGVLALFVAVGFLYRFAVVGFLVLFAYVELIDKTNYLNHYYLVTLVAALLAFMPLHRAGSVDAWLRPGLRSDTAPAWCVWTLRAQLGLVYFFAGVAKLEWHWLAEAQPMQIWLATKTDVAVVGPWLGQPWVAYAMSWAGCAFDLSIAGLLVWPRTRLPAYLTVVAFHVATGMLFNIGMFPWIMVGLTLIFFEPDWPRRVARRVRGSPAEPPPPRDQAVALAPGRLVPYALAAWFAVQVALPMRHVLYPGPAWWTGEGWRFSWRVLLVESRGHFTYEVTDPATGRVWVVHPERFLQPRQQHTASSSPDMILQLAHDLRDDFAARGVPGVEVRCDAWTSVNGRPSRRLVDPAVDLAAEPRWTPFAWTWVLPPG